MHQPFNFGAEDKEKTVYVRKILVADLPQAVRDQITGVDELYSVHRADGERVALVKDRDLAFVLAREHDLAPVSVH